MSEKTIMSMNDRAVKIEPPEDIKLEIEDDFDNPDGIVKSESCSEDNDMCLERFMNSEVTIEEEVKQELVETSTYECDVCNRSFAESDHLKEHMTDHIPNNSKESPFKCEICSKTFGRLMVLKRHVLIHNGIRPHECNICKKPYTRSDSLKRHMLTHSEIRPYECNICNKTFADFSNLKSHKLRHSGAQLGCESVQIPDSTRHARECPTCPHNLLISRYPMNMQRDVSKPKDSSRYTRTA
ncbi:zinc finger protein 768-like [Ctenocephalides felis]|uniref:zinc finger protein 768-like n=1 Tax=Ctenocephalides felis TaxID=7515 RepID=UPI000E6E5057|nr:zinc finger protein 768-like [Ctenocephalides felis]